MRLFALHQWMLCDVDKTIILLVCSTLTSKGVEPYNFVIAKMESSIFVRADSLIVIKQLVRLTLRLMTEW